MNKKGMSLIVLIVTLIVMSILAGVAILSLNNSTDEAKKIGFAAELKEITEAAQAYYLQYGELPVFDDKSYTKEELLAISSNSMKLQIEFNTNKDKASNYYKIDLSKLTQNDSLYGNSKSQNDFYVIGEDGNFVYYPLGVKIDTEIYFSFTEKLVQISDLEVTSSTNRDITSTKLVDKIVISKSTEEWTNTLSLTVNTVLNSDENIYYIIGSTKTKISSGMPYTLTLSSSTVASDSTLASALSQNEYIVFQKEDSIKRIMAKNVINIKNLDLNSPVVGASVVKKHSDYTSVEFTKASDDKSGISSSYYTTETEDYTASQLLNNGMKGDKYSIRLSTDATFVQFIVVDNAGNMSEVQKVNIE